MTTIEEPELALGDIDATGTAGKAVSFSHLAIPVLDLDRSIAFYARYAQMKVVKRRLAPDIAWLADGVRPFQLVLLAADPIDLTAPPTASQSAYSNARVAHPVVASAHIGFTCANCDEVRERAEWARAEGILEHGPADEAWPGGYCAYITDPSGHSIEFSYNQEAGYTAVFDPVCDLTTLRNEHAEGDRRWVGREWT